MKIKGILFDYFGVISSDEYWQFVKEDKNVESDFSRLSNAVNAGEITWKKFVSELSERTGTPVEHVNQLYKSERINPEMIAYIAELHRTYKTGLLTNAHHDFVEPLFERAHLYTIFDNVTVSSRVGVLKPDALIFERALGALDLEAHEAIFVDDIERNVEGAKQVGLHGLLYTDLKKLRHDIKQALSI